MNYLRLTLNTLFLLFASVSAVPAQQNQTPTSEDSDRMKYSGRVIDHRGYPVEDALVLAPSLFGYRKETPQSGQDKTDANGNFSVELVNSDSPFAIEFLWAYKKGYAARCVCPKLAKGAIVMKLMPEEGWRVEVHKPDGSPAEGITVKPYYFEVPNGVYTSDKATGLSSFPPLEIRHLLKAETSKRGIAIMRGVPRALISAIQLEHRDFGTQISRNVDSATLAEVGRFIGNIDYDGLDFPEDLRVYFNTAEIDGIKSVGIAEVTQDGYFQSPLLRTGTATLSINWPEDSDVRLVSPKRLQISAGQKNLIKIPTRPVVTVRGQILKEDNKEPVAGAVVSISDESTSRPSATTDENGWFQAKVVPGNTRLQVVVLSGEIQRDYAYPENVHTEFVIKETPVNEIEPILLPRLQKIQGQLQLADGAPAISHIVSLRSKTYDHIVTQCVSDETGTFTLKLNNWWKSNLEQQLAEMNFPNDDLEWLVMNKSIKTLNDFLASYQKEELDEHQVSVEVLTYKPLVLRIVE